MIQQDNKQDNQQLQQELELRYGPAFAQWVIDRMPEHERQKQRRAA